MKVSLIQTNSQGDKAANIAAAKELMERAISEEHPDLLVLPETFDFVGGTPADKLRAGESVPGGPAYSMCQEVARAHGVFVHAGSLVEKVPNEDKVHNTTAVFDRSGREVARYRYVPANALTLGGLFSVREPGEIVLGANFATTDPEAERKRKRAYRRTIERELAEAP